MKLTPLVVTIGRREDGMADHPDWTVLPMIQNDSQVRTFCPHGWIYDSSCGHDDNREDSPAGTQLGMLLCTHEFADEAMEHIPPRYQCRILTEAEAQTFYDDCHACHMDDVVTNSSVIQDLKNRLILAKEIDDAAEVRRVQKQIKMALDPANPAPGVRDNPRGKWDSFKRATGFTVE